MYGLAVAGAATVRALSSRGYDVVVADDFDTPERRHLADNLGVDLLIAPDDRRLAGLVQHSDLVVPAPGIPEGHRLLSVAGDQRRRVVSELELAYEWEQQRDDGPRPMLAITGTDGKTTTTLLTVAILEAAGVRSVAAGNTDVPLVEAIDLDVDVFVVECTSFRLAWTEHFRGEAAAWLNLAPDHLNWHESMETYAAAKAKIFANQRPTDVAIGFAGDPAVIAHLATSPGRRVTFGQAAADYRVENGLLVSPHGEIVPVASMRRHLPHDVTNGLAAAALVLESGLADASAVATALGSFVGPDIASSSSTRQMASLGSTIRRRRPRMPRPRRSTASTTWSSSPVGATRGSTSGCSPPRRSGSAPSSPSARRRTTSPRRSPPPALPC